MNGSTVAVKFYYPYDKLSGVSNVQIKIRKDTTVRCLLSDLLKKFPPLIAVLDIADSEQLNATTLLMVDGQVVDLETPLLPGQSLIIMPFISGG